MANDARNKKEQWRVFCAIDLPEPLREKLMAHIKYLREEVPEAKASWSRPDNVHLTLKFLGDVPKSSLEKLSSAISRATDTFEPFSVEVEGAGAFPSHRPPRVLWIGINDVSGNLAGLHGQLEEESARVGFPKEPRPFHPHLTIARLQRPDRARSLAASHREAGFQRAQIQVSELLLIRSELSSEGSKYTVISRHSLRGERGKGKG